MGVPSKELPTPSESHSDSEDEFSDSEEGSEWESVTDTDSDDDIQKPHGSKSKLCIQSSSSSSSESDQEAEQCPICLLRIVDQDVGTPESCDHNFCLECIQEWAKNTNQCPMDRLVFKMIFARHGVEGVIYKKIEVEDRQIPEHDEDEFAEGCEICGRHDNEEWMLLCDGCDLGFHCQCLTPALDSIPVGDWFCTNCRPHVPPDEPTPGPSVESTQRNGRQCRDCRLIGRTRVSERVRAAIASVRATRGRRIIVSASESSDDYDSEYDSESNDYSGMDLALAGTVEFDPDNPPPKAPPRPRSTKPRKRKSTSKRKSKKSKSTSMTHSTSSKRRAKTKGGRKRRRVKRRKKKMKKRCKDTGKVYARTKRQAPTTCKMRIADALGLASPPVGSTIPRVRGSRSEQGNGFMSSRQDNVLSLLGEGSTLVAINDSDDESMMSAQVSQSRGGGVATMRPAAQVMSDAIAIHRRSKHKLALSHSAPLISVQCPPCSTDLLGDILNDQNVLHRSNSDGIVIDDTNKPKVSVKDKNLINGRQCIGIGNGEQPNGNAKYTGPPASNSTNTTASPTEELNTPEHITAENQSLQGFDQGGEESGDDNAYFSPIESSEEENDDKETKDSDDKNDNSNRMPLQFDIGSLEPIESEEDSIKSSPMKPANDTGHDTSLDTATDTLEDSAQEAGNKEAEETTDYNPCSPTLDEPQYNPFSPTQESQDSGKHSDQESTNQNDKHNSSKDSDDESIKNKTAHDSAESDSDSENDSKKKRRIKRTSKDSDSEPIDTSILRRYSDTDSDSIPSKKAISDSEFSDTEPEDDEPQVDEEKRVDSEDYFTVQPTQQLGPSPEPNGLNTSTAPTFDSGDETPTEDEIPLPAGTDERIVVRGTIGGTTSLGHLPTSDTSGALPGMLDIPLPSTATIPLPDADDADIIPMPDCDIPAIRPGAPVRLTAAGIAVQNAVQNAAVSSRAEPIVVEDTEQTTTGDGGDIFDLTGPDNFINIEPSGQNYIEIIPIEDAGEGSNNTSNVTSNGTEQDKDHSDSDNNARPSRGDAFGRLGPIPNADAATKDQQSLLFAQREHPSFELEDGEQRSDLESPLQVTAPAVVEKVKFKKRKRKKHDRRSETPESDYHVDKSSSRKKDRRKEKERSLDREIEREREKERKKKKRDREREVRAEWGEYEQVSADDLELSLTSANKKRKKNKKKDRESEKENWMIEVDKYEEYRNKTRREKEKNIDKEFDAREYANKVYRYDNGGEWAATSDAEADHPRGRKSKKQRQRERRVTETSVKEREKSENRSRERIHKSRRSRTRSPVRRRDRSKRSYSRSRSRGRDRSSRARSPDRRRNKRSPRRQDRSRTREAREVRLASVDRDRRGRRNRDDRISPEPRKHSKKRRSYSRSPARKERRRSKNRSKSPKRDKEYYRERDRDDYRGSLALFAQSLKEVTEPQKASNRRVKMSKKHPDRLEVDVEQAVNRKSSDRNDRRRHRYSSEKDQRSDGDEVTIVAVKEAPARKKKKRHGKSTSGGNASKQTESSKTTTSLAASLSKSGRARVDSSPETTRPTLTGEPVDAPRRGFQPLDLPTRARTPPAARAASPAARSPPSDTYDPSRPTEEASPISTHSPIKRTPPRRKRQRKTNPDDIFRNLTPPSSGTDGDDDMVHRKGDKPLQPLLPPILQEEILMRHHRPIDGSRGTTAPSSTSASTVTSHGAASVNGVIPSSSQTLGATHRLPQFVPVSHHPPPARIGWPLSRPDTVLTSPGSSTTPLGINVSAGTGLQAPSSTELLPSAAKPSPSKQTEHITTDTSQQKDPVIARKSPQILSGLSALSAAPPPLPVKALKEMEQISQLLNAQAKLSSLLSSVQTEKKITVGTRKHKSTVPKEKLDDAVLDAASPRSDDGMALTSFSPPPISPAHRRAQAQSHNKTPVKHHKPPPASGAETGKEDDITSAVALDHKEKYLKKLNRQERVIEEVKLAVKPFYSRHVITKEEYKDIMRRAVPKICHSKGGDINGAKIRALVEAYVDRVTKSRKPNRHKKTNKPSISSVFAPKKATPAK